MIDPDEALAAWQPVFYTADEIEALRAEDPRFDAWLREGARRAMEHAEEGPG